MTPAELTEARKALGLSQVALSEVLGIHPTILNRWERGRAKIPPYLHWAMYGIAAERVNRESLALFDGRGEPTDSERHEAMRQAARGLLK